MCSPVRECGLAGDTFIEWIDFFHHCVEENRKIPRVLTSIVFILKTIAAFFVLESRLVMLLAMVE